MSVWTHAVFDWPLWLALALVLLAAGHLMGARVFRRYPVLSAFGAGVLCTLLVVSMFVRASAPRTATQPAPILAGTGYENGGRRLATPSITESRSPASTPSAGLPPSPSSTGTRPASDGDAPGRVILRGTDYQPALRGFATWYPASGLVAAAGPNLRRALGPDWRGTHVSVCASRCVTVRLSDWCACGPRKGEPTLLDLSDDAFHRLAPLPVGVLRVRVTVLGGIGLPETDR